MKDKPKVSIIINNYNYVLYLSEAINSALAQTYGQIEVVVIDDGSTDGSREIINSFGNAIVSVYKENGGQASALNVGLSVSSGELIQFLDADDILDSECTERLVEQWNPGVVAIQFKLQCCNKNGIILPGKTMPSILSGGSQREQLLKTGTYNYSSTSGNLFARDALVKIFPIPESIYRICADTYLQTMIPFYGLIVSCQFTLGRYRIHGNNGYYSNAKTRRVANVRESVNADNLRKEIVSKCADKFQIVPRNMMFIHSTLPLLQSRMVLQIYDQSDLPTSCENRRTILIKALRMCVVEGFKITYWKGLIKILGAACIPKWVLKRILRYKL